MTRTTLDRSGGTALYRQIAEDVKARIADGSLPTGTRLPTIRELSSRLGVTRLTVQHAYSELQADGWIASRVGRGSFVTGRPRPEGLMAVMGRTVSADAICRDHYRLKDIAGMYLMGMAEPDGRLFSQEDFWGALAEVRGELSLFGYSPPQGDPRLRAALLPLLRARGVRAEPDELIVTSGVSQGLSLVAQALARPGDCVAVERPTYLGMLNLLRAQGLEALGVPLDEEGPDLAELERLVIQRRPRFFYTVPGFQNPTGLTMSPSRRRDLLALAGQYGLLIVEDDLYSRLAYDGPVPPALKADDDQGLVVYLDSVSKVLMPGLRTGWLVAPPPLRERLIVLRHAQDLCGNGLVQRALASFLEAGCLKAHLQHALPRYRERRDALLAALRHSMPRGVRWTEPGGGFCLWLTLPEGGGYEGLYPAALRRGLSFTPGEVFLEHASGEHLRLCFGSQPPESIRRGVALLAALIETQSADAPLPARKLADWPPLV